MLVPEIIVPCNITLPEGALPGKLSADIILVVSTVKLGVNAAFEVSLITNVSISSVPSTFFA